MFLANQLLIFFCWVYWNYSFAYKPTKNLIEFTGVNRCGDFECTSCSHSINENRVVGFTLVRPRIRKIVKDFSLFGININFSNADMKFLFLMNDWKLSLLNTDCREKRYRCSSHRLTASEKLHHFETSLLQM